MTEASERRTISIEVFTADWSSPEIPSNLGDYIQWLQGILASVPEEYRDSAGIDFDSDYESSRVSVEIDYERLETDEEIQGRLDAITQQSRLRDERDRAQYEKLKAKFEGGQ